MKTISYIFAASIAIIILQSAAMAVELHCPASIAVTQTVNNAPTKWMANNSQREHRLGGAGFTSGHPSKMAFLKPDYTKSKGKLRIVVTSVDGIALGGDWLNCIYDETSATVAQPLPPEFKECSVTYEVIRENVWDFKSIQCK